VQVPRPANPGDAAAKTEAMSAFFGRALQRVDYLNELQNGGYDTEALTLCLTYIDSFAQWLHYPRKGVGENFVDALSAHEPVPYFSLIHPSQMIRQLRRMKGRWPSHAKVLESIFPGPTYQLMDRLAFARSLSTGFVSADLRSLQKEVWRGTIGAVAYFWLRNPSIHQFGSSPSLSFGSTRHQGNELPRLGLVTLLPPLRSIINETRARSMATCEWFGDDRIMFEA